MTIDQVDMSTILSYCRVDSDDADSVALIKNIIKPAAKSYIRDYTGMDAAEMERHDDLAVPFLALCSFLYDNRSLAAITDKQNAVVQSFLDLHGGNLL